MRVVIVGASQAGTAAARTLRDEGFDGVVTLVGAEPHLPYERPPLSKEYLRGEDDVDDTLILSEGWYVDNSVELRLGTSVRRLVATDAAVELMDGTLLEADTVLLTTGGRPRRLPGLEPGDHVLELRTRDDADRLRPYLVPGARVVVVGAGFIGSEVAASAHGSGADVTVLEAVQVPLGRVLGDEVGAHLGAMHRDQGIDLRTGVAVDNVEDHDSGARVTISDGTTVDGDVVVVGVGMIPNDDLALDAGLEVDGGVIVDELCRSSTPQVLAAGDVARHWHPLYGSRVRVEHFDNANKQGAAAARSILGRGAPYTEPHWFWSDQYDFNLQYVGHATSWDRIVIRGWPEDNEFSAWYLDQGVLRAVFALDAGGDILAAKELIAAGASPDPDALADLDTDLFELAGLG
ncbi:MAG: FAD-dependent oxidoreductase [Actinobacteria bacterium]|nr:FAD-dependent oxidoreductase [Actinomycetota bacterium]